MLFRSSWQEREEILRLFDSKPASARRAYRIFVEQGIEQGRRYDLAGGGLIRSAGGWEGLKQKREEGRYQRSDERILGDSDFVSKVLTKTEEIMSKKEIFRAQGMDLDKIAERVSELMKIRTEDVWAEGKQQYIVNARSLFCF